MACLFYLLFITYCVLFVKSSAAITGNFSFPRTTHTYYLDSGLPSTWSTNNSLVMRGWNMKVILSVKGFYFGFYCSGSCNFYLLSVVAIGGGSHNAVWSANTDHPLRGHASVQLMRDKGLVLRDSEGNKVWSVCNNTSKSVVGMNLTEAGNLVLFDNQSAIVWHSFDHPVDALLIGQRLYKGQKLVPSSFATLWRVSPFFATLTGTANFSAFISTSDGRSLMYYQLTLNKDSRNRAGLQYGEDEEKEYVVNLGRFEASYPRKSIEYVKLGADGHLRTYWHNLEGSDTNVVDMVTQECLNSPNGYLLEEVRNCTFSNISNASTAIILKTTMDGCKQACLQNCSCSAVAFSYESNDVPFGNCYMSSEMFTTGDNRTVQTLPLVKKLNANDASSPSPSREDIPNPVLTNFPSGKEKNTSCRTELMAAASSVDGIVLFLVGISFFSVAVLQLMRLKDDQDDIKQVPGMPLSFSYEDLEIATEKFKEKLGSGGFGSVFKGVLADGTMIAVKRLDKMSQEMREFLAEVETIGRLHHFNLVRLVGFCAENSCRLLVYEYMTNGSLDNWIFNRSQAHRLSWQTRKKIILDVAKGLAYFHEECRQKIIHLDIKPHNILLDENFNAKVSDFGLSKLIERDESQVLIPMRGTPGYLAPELQRSIVTVKVDVYSFGIVILEIVSKRRNVDSSLSESSFHLLDILQKKAQENKLIEIVEDLDEDMQNDREEVVRMISIGAWCLQNDHTKRPSMSTVVKVLEGVMEVESNISYTFSHARAYDFVANDHITVAPQASILSAPR